MRFKPTAAQWRMIKEIAFLGHVPDTDADPMTSVAAVRLEARSNVNVDDPERPISINKALVTRQWPECGDLDLYDHHTGYTQAFRNGADLTPDGRGLFDFYIYNRYRVDEGLCGNVQVRIEDGRMAAVWISGGKPYSWTPETGIARGQ